MSTSNHPKKSSVLPRGGPLLAIGGVVSFAAAAAWYSHYAQKRDKAVMRAGVERDKERLRVLRQKQQQQREQEASSSS